MYLGLLGNLENDLSSGLTGYSELGGRLIV